jgi:C4-dicarboxylate-specific signal transduction histidine kinase
MKNGNALSLEDILRLISMKEVFGGFAHEVAQPLNAIMIASQVIQLKLDRSGLSEEEKVFLVQKLSLVSSQVNRAAQIVEGLRAFTRGSKQELEKTDMEEAFERVHSLMGQQFIGRGIELVWEETGGSLPPIRGELNVVEGVLVQGLAFARDAVEALVRWHDENGIAYKGIVQVKLVDVDGNAALHASWSAGELPAKTHPTDPASHVGLSTANSVLSVMGGSLQTSQKGLLIIFP